MTTIQAIARPLHAWSGSLRKPPAVAAGVPRFQGRPALPAELSVITGVLKYWNGVVPLKSPTGQWVQASILPVKPGDAAQVDDWYNPKHAGEPTYAANTKWRDWWRSLITSPPAHLQVLKLALSHNRILGVIALQHHLVDKTDGINKTYLQGIRINPRCNAMMTQEADFKGVGAALTTHAVVESLKAKTDGLFLNATMGAEPFYRKLGLSEKPALDGIRTAFYLNGDDSRKAFLQNRFQLYASAANLA